MADDFPHHGPDEPKPATPSEGDFPADFFDDMDDPAPAHHPVHTHESPEPLPQAMAPVNNPPPPPPPPVPPQATRPKAAPTVSGYTPPPDVERSRMPIFPIGVGVLMIGALAGAWYVGRQQSQDAASKAGASGPAPAAASASPATPDTSGPAAKSADSAAAPTPRTDGDAEEVKALKTQLARLTDEHTALHKKVDDQAKPEPTPDLKPVQAKLDELAKSVEAVTPLSEKLDKLDERVGQLDGAVKSVRDEVSGLAGEVKKMAAAPSNVKPAADSALAAEGAGSETSLAQGAELFRSGKYKEADEVFRKLESGDPKDARVYYYAALAHGLSTGDWQGEPLKKAAAKGAELEKAGSPKAQEVDSAFADLPANLKPWLTFFRKSAK